MLEASTTTPLPSLSSGYACSSRVAIVLSAACAWAIETPDFSRPTPISHTPALIVSRSRLGDVLMGTHTSGRRTIVPVKPSGVMPTMVKGRPLSVTARPTTDGSPPNCSCQKR